MADEERPKGQSGPKGFQMVDDPASPAETPMPPITFGTFILSLSTSALFQLGEGADPEGGKAPAPNLPLAQQTIDILEMLADKTAGNLDADEEQLVEAVLHDLRMRYVSVSREKGGSE